MDSRTTLRSLASRAAGLLCAASLAAGPALAHAQPEDAASSDVTPAQDSEAERLSDQAVEAFNDKRYEESIGLFEQAYALNSNPNYLFNIGRVYEEKGDLEQAVVHYQKFVAQPGVDLESREAATERLRVLREALRQLEEDKEDEDVDDPPEQLADPVEPETDEPPADRKRGQRIAGYVLLGAGGAGLIVGGVLGGVASSTAGDADNAEFVDDRLRIRDDARRQARAADAMFITGGVLAAAGLVLVLTTLGKGKKKASADARTRRFAVSPAATPTSAGAVVHGRF
ncbi:MAG: hypothetical protein ACE37F_31675 [Nannocystaceae bacterium]|nr:hypothetical protein [bacterium]